MTSHTSADPDTRRRDAGTAVLAAMVCAAAMGPVAPAAVGTPAVAATTPPEAPDAPPEAPDAPPEAPDAPPRVLDAPPRVLDAPPVAGRPSVGAEGAVLWDPADERVLHGRNARRPRPMASLTKMLTSLLLVEHADSPDETITTSARAVSVGGATVGLRTGQEVPLPDLVAAMMVESGNDAAAAAAEHVAGSQRAFVELMTRRAEELGAGSAAFVNASGLTNDPAHHASPVGLARIATAAMAKPVIARYAATQAVDPPGLPRLVNRNELLGSYPGADGIKTGYTSVAGYCLAASATRDGWQLMAVVLDSSDRFADAAELLDWGFATFDRARAAQAGQTVATWRRGDVGTALTARRAAGVTVPADTPAWVQLRLAPHVDGAVPAGGMLGRARLRVAGEVVAGVALTADEALAAPPQPAADAPPAKQLGQGLAQALRGLARTAPVRARAARQDGQRPQR